MRRTTLAITAGLVLAAFARPGGQRDTPLAPRDVTRPVEAGAASISGVVVSDEPSAPPIRRATVTLRNTDLGRSRVAVTDEAGRFLFAGLPAGRFSISVSKPAYVTTSYGARSLRGQGLTLVVLDGQRLSDLLTRVPRGAVVTGRVLDQNGRPATGTRVGVAEVVTVNGERTFRRNFGATSDVDDRGIYRIFGVAPGTYIVGASGGTSVLGGVPRVTTAAEVQWAMRGEPAGPGSRQGPPLPGQAFQAAPVFFPGTADSMSASLITLAAGEERSGIDFTVSYVPTSSLEGTVTTSDGKPARNATVLAVPTTMSVQVGVPLFPPRATVTPDGRFSVVGLSPGHYLLTARAASGTAASPTVGRGAVNAQDLWAVSDVDVAGQDISNIALTLAPGMSISGRVVFDGKGTPPPADLTTTNLSLRAPPSVLVSLGAPSQQPAADGTFRFTGVAPGPYLLSANIAAPAPVPQTTPAWVLRSAVADGHDLLDTPLDVRPGIDTTGVVVTFTDQVTQLTGTLSDRTGRPAPSYYVIAYATNPAVWQQQSRWIRMPTRPATDGRFTISGLPPGEYYVAALSEFDPQEWYTPAFLQQLVPMSLKITLAEGEKKVQDLKIAAQ